MAEGTPVEYEDRNDEVKILRETDLIGSSHDARSLASAPMWWSWGTTLVRVVMRAAALGKDEEEADPSDRTILHAPPALPVFGVDLTGDGKLDCFAWDYTEMPGLDRSIIEHRLPLKKGFRPFQQRARQMKAEILEEVKKEIEKMLAAGFIRPCRYAEWISSIVPVEKKDGRWRVAIDFRDLNRATPKDEYPMPVAETLINAAAGHKVLSFMDGNAGYNQIFMAQKIYTRPHSEYQGQSLG
ncbi:hypothetical protein QYE76_004292 [Lolium multiflorum]|uniref:Gag-pol polyprotein n=1 Tax=Lolium multiflorum TaxID=4521 RepID=A0AAD8RS92_LOLMU|nr:hypothetical protein QYE76_004292 [Lolium multiflorum]